MATVNTIQTQFEYFQPDKQPGYPEELKLYPESYTISLPSENLHNIANLSKSELNKINNSYSTKIDKTSHLDLSTINPKAFIYA